MSRVNAQPGCKSEIELSVKLTAVKEENLITFERWPHYMAPQLVGRAQLVFANLSIMGAGDYNMIKETILARYNI